MTMQPSELHQLLPRHVKSHLPAAFQRLSASNAKFVQFM
jgi:hypothetical protein